MNDEDEHEHEETEVVNRPWSWMFAAAVTANLFGNVSHALWAFFDDIKDMAKAHVATADDVSDAWSALHRDLESLPTTEQ